MKVQLTDSVFNFVTRLKPDDIENIRKDIALSDENYTLFYFIDTFDVYNYYLPYIQNDVFQGSSRNDIAHKMIAYTECFASTFRNRIMVPEEYMVELKDVRGLYNRQVKQISRFRQNLLWLSRIVEGNLQHDEEIRNNFEMALILLIISTNEKGPEKNFFTFIDDQRTLQEKSQSHAPAYRYAQALLDNVHSSGNAIGIFERFAAGKAFGLMEMDTERRFRYLENTFRDITAIDRINELNKAASFNSLDKVCFIYLSSASHKSELIFSILSGEGLPVVNGFENFNFHRTIDQAFLFKILRENETYADNKELQQQTLDSLKRLASQTPGQSPLEFREEDIDTLTTLQRALNKYSAGIDNHFYFRLFDKYKARGSARGLQVLIERASDFLQREREVMRKLNYNISNYIQTSRIQQLLYETSTITFHFGSDIISNSFHHFPYLVFMADENERLCTEELYRAFDILSENFLMEDIPARKLVPYLKTLFVPVPGRTQVEQEAYEFIITTYLNVIMLRDDKESRIPVMPEQEVLNLLRKQIKIIEFTYSQPATEAADPGKLSMQPVPNRYVREMQYMQLWLLRRNLDFDSAVSLGEELTNTYPHDARFWHGLGLAYTSRAYARLMNKEMVPSSQWDRILHILEHALRSYSKLLADVHTPYAGRLIRKGMLAILNSQASCFLRKYEIENDTMLLAHARTCLQQIKDDIRMYDIRYDDCPGFNHTEAELEFYEADIYMQNAKLQQAYSKVILARGRAQYFKDKGETMHAYFQGIGDRIDELRLKISVMLGII